VAGERNGRRMGDVVTDFRKLWRLSGLVVLMALAGATSFGTPARAQTAFCPSITTAPSPVNSVPGIVQTSGKCTNPGIAGAFSGAALASQAIGDLAGTSTSLETSTAVEAIGQRRERQVEACPAGETPVDGICKPIPPPVIVAAPATPAPRVAKHRAKPKSQISPRSASTAPAAPPAPIILAPQPPPVVDQSFRIGSWAQGFGNYEHRTGSQNSSFDCCTSQPGNPITPITLDVTSTTSSGGFVGGIDATKRGLTGPQDGLIFGLLAGFTWTDITVRTTVLSGKSITANGSSLTTADIDGPSLGFYATYFNGPFSNEFLLKNDFLSLNESNTQTLGFGSCVCFGVPVPFTAASSGSGSTNLNQLTISDNLEYKIPVSDRVWVSPTATFSGSREARASEWIHLPPKLA